MTDLTEAIELTAVAHGGWTVGRLDGRVIFVRGGLPGERVTVRVTDDSRKSFWRGEVAEVLRPAAERVTPPCPVADVCGGCDFQHVEPGFQRELKRRVVAEQLSRLAGIDWRGQVEAVGGVMGWRTRMRYLTEDGRVGLRKARSHELVDLPEQGCLIADPSQPGPVDLRALADETGTLEVITSSGAETILTGHGVLRGPAVISQTVGTRTFTLAADGFWQVHPDAARVLTDAVVEAADPLPGEVALDLYCGVGLFAAALAERGLRVVGVESNRVAARYARRNVTGARIIDAPLERALLRLPRSADVVVVDPPRKGVGARVLAHLGSLQPRVIVHVACDPASLARDAAELGRLGYTLQSLRAFDLFGMTHHVECVASFTRA